MTLAYSFDEDTVQDADFNETVQIIVCQPAVGDLVMIGHSREFREHGDHNIKPASPTVEHSADSHEGDFVTTVEAVRL